MCKVSGYSEQELKGHSTRIFYADEQEFERVGKLLYAQVKDENIGAIETTWVCKDGTTKQVLLSAAYMDYNNPGKGAIVTALDISILRSTEKNLVRSEEKFRLLVEMTPDWIWETDALGNYTYVSPRVKDILGYEVSELLSKNFCDLMPEEEAARVKSVFLDIAARKIEFHDLENTVISKNGALMVMDTSGSPFFDDQGNLLGYRGIDRNITEKKEADKIIKTTLKTSADIITAMPSALCIFKFAVPDKLVLVHANPEANRITGLDLDEFYNKEFSSMWPGVESWGLREKILKCVSEQKYLETDNIYYQNDEIKGSFKIRAFPLPDEKVGVVFEKNIEV